MITLASYGWRTRLVLACALGAAGCFDLPDVPSGVCGNGVLEPGEDCDSFADPALGSGLVCNASCRYTCTPGSEPSCPAGWGCGMDQVCRHGTGTYSVAGPVMTAAENLGAAGLDGDGRTSVIGSSGGTLDVLRASNGLSTNLLRLGGFSLFTTADLGGIGRSSILTSDGTSVIGWRTTADHGFQSMLATSNVPAAFATAQGVRFVPMRTDANVDHDVPFVLLQPSGQHLVLTTQFALQTEPAPASYTVPGITGALTDLLPPAIGNVDGAAGEELALGFAGTDKIAFVTTHATATSQCGVLGTCWMSVAGSGEIEAPTVKLLSLVSFAPAVLGDPPDTNRRRLVFADVDNDGFQDLVIPLDSGDIVVANGNGTGSFGFGVIADAEKHVFSDPGTHLPCTGSTWGTTVSAMPLASGDFDGDGLTDYVVEDGIMLGRPSNQYCRATRTVTATAAIALDGNGDGRTDVALIDSGFVVLETQGTQPGEFDAHPIAIPDGATATTLETAEVDGDYLGDVVIHATRPDGTPEIWIAHGTTDLRQIEVTEGPDVSTAVTSAAGDFESASGSTGGLVVYGHDAAGGGDYTAAVAATPGGLASELEFEVAGGLSTAFDVEVGRFLPGGADGSSDLLVLHSGARSPLAIDVWPDQGSVLHELGHMTGSIGPKPAVSRNGIRVFGDIDGDGIDELCALVDDGGSATTATCDDVVIGTAGLETTTKQTVTLPYRLPVAAQLADVDHDGRVDLVAAFAGDGGVGGGVVVVYDLEGAAKARAITAQPAHSAIAVNVDEDPELELVAVTDAIHIFELSGEDPTDLQVIETGPFSSAITTSDLDGDGVRELIIGQSALSVLVLWPTTNTGGAP